MGDDTYGYAYDQIGNRIVTTESAETTEYVANNLNQYAQISVPSVPSVVHPTHDLDGNQTLIRTSTGIWHVTYNAENRPVVFSNAAAVIEMAYDCQGRRFEYKETVSGSPTRHERYLYRGYLQLAALNLLDGTNVLHTLVWDPTEPVATRPLALQTQSGWFTYAFDQVKNVTELFDASGNIAAAYAYAPFGAVTAATGPAVAVNPLTFSSEIADTTLGLQYYNFRHLNTLDGRWISRDPIFEIGGCNVYKIVSNNVMNRTDIVGLWSFWDTLNLIPGVRTLLNLLTNPKGSKVSHYAINHLSVEACQCEGSEVAMAAELACSQDVAIQGAKYVGSYVASNIIGSIIDAIVACALPHPVVVVLLASEGSALLSLQGKSISKINTALEEAQSKCSCSLFMQVQTE